MLSASFRPRSAPAALFLAVLILTAAGWRPQRAEAAERGFVSLFDGHSLAGWHTSWGAPYVAHDGILTCPIDGGNLFTDDEYGDFDFRFEFRLTKGANNGIGIRAPFQGDAAYVGMEIQVLDDSDPQYATLQPWQFHGSIYGVVPALRGALKPTGEWNAEEILARGRQIRISLNRKVIVNANLDDVHDAGVLQQHPGLQRTRGHVGFLGHDSVVDFRNIRIRSLDRPRPDNVPPPGYTALFDGKDLKGWQALVGDPPSRARMTPEELQQAHVKADPEMLKHWKVVDGVITYDGKNNNLCTIRDFKDFALRVDWKIGPGGDSGIYLRGSPQVQIWEPNSPGNPNREGSGGLYNNVKNPSHPALNADHPVGEWNRFLIVMVDTRVTVYLNGQLVVDRVPLENYWQRDRPIYPTGPIELQHHNSPLYFKNIFVRELP